MRGVQAHRQQQRTHLALEQGTHPAVLYGRTLAMRDDPDALLRQLWEQFVLVERVLPVHQLAHRGRNGLESRPAASRTARRRQVQLGAHFKKLIQVRGHDGQEAQALEQRHVGPRSPVENAFVERQDAQIAVQQRGFQTGHGGGWHGRPRQRRHAFGKWWRSETQERTKHRRAEPSKQKDSLRQSGRTGEVRKWRTHTALGVPGSLCSLCDTFVTLPHRDQGVVCDRTLRMHALADRFRDSGAPTADGETISYNLVAKAPCIRPTASAPLFH